MKKKNNISPLQRALRRELELFRENRRMKVGAFIVIGFIPFLYAYTFLSSIWDPFKNLKNLPVAYANLDKGTEFRNRQVTVGEDIVRELLARGDFHYKALRSEAEVRESVSRGEVYFAVIIPEDFSANALPGYKDKPGSIKLVMSEGLGFTSALIGRRLSNELTHKLNEQLNARRWEIVFEESIHANSGLKQLRQALKKLRGGAGELANGQEEFNQHFTELHSGLKKLSEGSVKIRDGLGILRTEGGKIPFFGGKVSDGAGRLEDGSRQLTAGLQTASEGSTKLLDGSKRLSQGSKEIATGIDLIYKRIPAHVNTPPGDALGLATSVIEIRESLTSGVTYGDAFAPYFLALSLWLGVVICTFFFYFRRVREQMRREPQWMRVLTKLFLPFLLVTLQALVTSFGTYHWLHMQMQSVFTYTLVCLQTSWIFLLIIFSCILIFRDAGRLVALLFLVFQLAAAGGAFPVEMSGGIFQDANPFLPFTNIVKALRAANLGAYDGHYVLFLAKAWLLALLIFGFAWLIARWKYVPDAEYTLAADI